MNDTIYFDVENDEEDIGGDEDDEENDGSEDGDGDGHDEADEDDENDDHDGEEDNENSDDDDGDEDDDDDEIASQSSPLHLLCSYPMVVEGVSSRVAKKAFLANPEAAEKKSANALKVFIL
jgi:hypothetical protein